MSWSGPGFVIAMIGMSYAAWLISSWIRAKHGYPVENEFKGLVGRSDPEADRKIALLTNENGALKDQMGRLEERIAVLERITTDPARRIADEIERLR